ncbi:MAG: ribulose-phosphate 3-epimerase [Candidatus Omnitrophica bacterium]|nr:ribulose-phosphate 3-epimerase [Candidatus Omnitrophota bacterium]MDD5237115.1 ribulose-phosphate 3-epimerase [Candidatus Omnitrophota bacterium]MDD5610151.1 ribulose-phosphate 3-epimerase [Candidatus Omnitrophota bacterium]
MKTLVAASILSADFAHLAEEIKRVERAGCDLIHVDVMDGHFVPNITIGPCVVRDIRQVARLPLDVHLMIENPEKYTAFFVKAGSDMLTLHAETISHPAFKKQKKILGRIKLGISLNPGTPFKKIIPYLDTADFVLVMSVNPGFGGQEFIPSVLPKIKKIREIFRGDISVDGGMNEKTAGLVKTAGANIIAAGSFIFKSKNYKQSIERIRHA